MRSRLERLLKYANGKYYTAAQCGDWRSERYWLGYKQAIIDILEILEEE